MNPLTNSKKRPLSYQHSDPKRPCTANDANYPIVVIGDDEDDQDVKPQLIQSRPIAKPKAPQSHRYVSGRTLGGFGGQPAGSASSMPAGFGFTSAYQLARTGEMPFQNTWSFTPPDQSQSSMPHMLNNQLPSLISQVGQPFTHIPSLQDMMSYPGTASIQPPDQQFPIFNPYPQQSMVPVQFDMTLPKLESSDHGYSEQTVPAPGGLSFAKQEPLDYNEMVQSTSQANSFPMPKRESIDNNGFTKQEPLEDNGFQNPLPFGNNTLPRLDTSGHGGFHSHMQSSPSRPPKQEPIENFLFPKLEPVDNLTISAANSPFPGDERPSSQGLLYVPSPVPSTPEEEKEEESLGAGVFKEEEEQVGDLTSPFFADIKPEYSVKNEFVPHGLQSTITSRTSSPGSDIIILGSRPKDSSPGSSSDLIIDEENSTPIMTDQMMQLVQMQAEMQRQMQMPTPMAMPIQNPVYPGLQSHSNSSNGRLSWQQPRPPPPRQNYGYSNIRDHAMFKNLDMARKEMKAIRLRATKEKLEFLPKATQPHAIRTPMLGHQLQALQWLLKMESPSFSKKLPLTQCWYPSETPGEYINALTSCGESSEDPDSELLHSGGILADDMGLGKTLQIISLIMSDPAGSGPTLIVCPLSVMSNWQKQIEEHVRADKKTRTLIFHSQKAKGIKSSDLRNYDVVITTYGRIASEETDLAKARPLRDTTWRRVVLDEGHTIRNSSTKTFKAAVRLRAKSKWVVTGTPIVNKKDDLRSLALFIGVHESTVEKPAFNRLMNSSEAAQTFVADLCLRRTKDMPFINLKLPPKTEHIEYIDFEPKEMENYQVLFVDAQQAARQFFGKEKNALWTTVLERLLRLRQFCDHWTMSAKRALEDGEDEQGIWAPEDHEPGSVERLEAFVRRRELCPLCVDTLRPSCVPVMTECGHGFCDACIRMKAQNGLFNCPKCGCEQFLGNLISSTFDEEDDIDSVESRRHSSKTAKLFQVLERTLQNPDSKIVIFSQWTSFLNIIEKGLQDTKHRWVRLDGTMASEERDQAITGLQTNPRVRIMLASLKTAGVGITLTAADTVILADTWWAPAIEDQAIDRIHRLGQTRPTTVYRLVVKGTVEEGVIRIQDEKREIFASAFQEKARRLNDSDAQGMVRRLLQ